MKSFEAKRITREWTFQVQAPPRAVFPLLCPVRECDWIDGWSSEMIFSQSGFAEKDCIFETEFPHMGRWTWVVSLYDRERFRIEFVITRQGSHVEKLEIQVEETADRGSRLHWVRRYTGLSEEGNSLIETLVAGTVDSRMKYLEKALNHYCRTGSCLPASRPGGG